MSSKKEMKRRLDEIVYERPTPTDNTSTQFKDSGDGYSGTLALGALMLLLAVACLLGRV